MVLRVLVALALLVSVARADDKPWAAGVSEADQKRAMDAFAEANELYEKGNYLESLAKYNAAIKIWDHPAIHYNKAMCLISLERTLDAFEAMEKAMAQGEAPLGKDLYREGKRYLSLLGGQVATLTVELKTQGARVLLDGKTPVTPGSTHRVLAKDEHTLIGDKPGYKTKSVPIKLEGGKTTKIELVLELEERGRTVRRWVRWKPWVVVGASGLIALAGVGTVVSSASKFDKYDGELALACPGGCARDSDAARGVEHFKDEAYSRQNLGYGIIAASGVTLGVGLLLVVLNQPRLVGGVKPNIGTEQVGATLELSW